MTRTAVAFTAAILGFSGWGMSGCETSRETSDGRPMPPQPVRAPNTPEAAQINAIALVLGPKPEDTNGNLRPDRIQIEAYLFARPFPTPRWADGSFEFLIYRVGDSGSPDRPNPEPLRTWTFSPERLDGMRSQTMVGPSYRISLSLIEGGATDDLGVTAVDLVARFHPADGSPAIQSTGVRTLSLTMPTVEPGR